MKKTIIVALSAIIGASLVTGNGIAQRAANPSYAASKSIKTSLREDNKSVAGNTIDPVEKTSIKESKNAIKATKINLRVTHHLNRNFKNPSDVLWYTDDNIKVAKFNINDQSAARVAYDKNGGWLYTIITYLGNQMPREITSRVNDEYNRCNISMVKEISLWDKTFHLVYVEDNNSYKELLVYNGEITVYNELKKIL